MLRNAQLVTSYDFSGGININVPPHLIQDNECFANLSTFDGTKNCHWDNGIVKRKGTEIVGTLNLIDRSDCESTTPPMIFDETVPHTSNTDFERDAEEHAGTYGYKITKTVASETNAYIDICDNADPDDMHGLIAGFTYIWNMWVKVPVASGIALNEVYLRIYDYVAAGWDKNTGSSPTAFDTWQKISITRTIRTDAIAGVLRIFESASAANTEYFYIDDISLVNIVGAKVYGKRFYRSAAPAKTTICAIDDGNNVKHHYLDGSSVFQEIVKGGSQIAAGNDIHLTTWKDQLYSASGNQLLQIIKYNGSWSIIDITGLTYKPQYICHHKDRLFAAGGDMPEGYLECTGYESDSSWSGGTGEAFNVGYKDGDPIRQLISLRDNLIVYKQDSIWVLRGDNAQNWFQHRDEKAVGCYAPHSVADVVYGHIFLSIDNIYFFDGERIIPIGDNIKPWLDLIPITYRKNACATYYNGWYRLSFTNGTYNNKELLFDVNRFIATGRAAWWLNDGRNINNYIVYDGPDDDNTIYMCDSNAGYLRKMEVGTQDDGVDVENQFYSKHFSMGNPNLEKIFDRLKVDLSLSIGTVYLTLVKGLGIGSQLEVEIDTGPATNVWGTGIWGVCKWQGAVDVTRFSHEVAIPAKMDGPTMAFLLKHKTSQANVKFYGMSLAWAPKSF